MSKIVDNIVSGVLLMRGHAGDFDSLSGTDIKILFWIIAACLIFDIIRR